MITMSVLGVTWLFFFFYRKWKLWLVFISNAPAALPFDSQLEEACSCPDTANKPPAAKGPVIKSFPSHHHAKRLKLTSAMHSISWMRTFYGVISLKSVLYVQWKFCCSFTLISSVLSKTGCSYFHKWRINYATLHSDFQENLRLHWSLNHPSIDFTVTW